MSHEDRTSAILVRSMVVRGSSSAGRRIMCGLTLKRNCARLTPSRRGMRVLTGDSEASIGGMA